MGTSFDPAFVAGHSLGVSSARLLLPEGLSFAEGLKLVSERALGHARGL